MSVNLKNISSIQNTIKKYKRIRKNIINKYQKELTANFIFNLIEKMIQMMIIMNLMKNNQKLFILITNWLNKVNYHINRNNI